MPGVANNPRHALLVALVVVLVALLLLIFAALTVAPMLVIVLGLMTYVVWWYVSRENRSFMHNAQVIFESLSRKPDHYSDLGISFYFVKLGLFSILGLVAISFDVARVETKHPKSEFPVFLGRSAEFV